MTTTDRIYSELSPKSSHSTFFTLLNVVLTDLGINTLTTDLMTASLNRNPRALVDQVMTTVGIPTNTIVEAYLHSMADALDTADITFYKAVLLYLLSANFPPLLIGTISDQSDAQDDPIAGLAAADYFDSDDTLTFGASGLPTGLSIDTGTGAVSGTPTVADDYDVTITASDAAHQAATQSFVWTITP